MAQWRASAPVSDQRRLGSIEPIAAMGGRKRRLPPAADCVAMRTRAQYDVRPWGERQPHVLWKCVLDSGYVKQGDAVKCMRVCRQWRDYVNGAKGLWQRIDIGRSASRKRRHAFTNWSDATADAIAAKRPKEITFNHSRVRRHQLSAILERNAQLRRLAFVDVPVATLRALDSLQAPLHFLRVTSCPALNDAAFAKIVHSAPVLKQLTELHLYGYTSMGGDAAMQLIAGQFTQLNVLHMEQCHGITSAALGHLCGDTAHTRTTLRQLKLDDCFRIRDDIADNILAMTSLKLLRVQRVPGCTGGWAADLQRRYEERHNRRIDIVGVDHR